MRYSFEGYVLDPYRRTLSRDGVEIPLGERAFSVLLLLVDSAGELLTKQELMDRVWGDVAVVEDNLVKAVGEVRHALGDHPAEARFVRTVHRRGYRFVAPVSRLGDRVVTRREATTPSRPETRRHRVITWGAMALVLMLIAAGVVILLRPVPSTGGRVPSLDATPPLARWKLRPMEGVPSGLFKPAFSPASDLLVAVMGDPQTGAHSLALIDPRRPAPVQLTHDIEVRGPDPVFSADGRDIWFTTYRHDADEGLVPQVMEIPAVGGMPRTLIPRASAASPDPDGVRIAAATVTPGGTGIVVIEDERRVRIAERGYWPRWSPDGRWIAYTTSNPEGGDGHLMIVHPDGSGTRQLTDVSTQLYGLCWSSHSDHVIFSSDLHGSQNLWIVDVAGRDLQPVTRGPGSFTSPSFSIHTDHLVFAYSPQDEALLFASSPAAPASILADQSDFFSSALSPDGRVVAIAGENPSRHPTLSLLVIDSG